MQLDSYNPQMANKGRSLEDLLIYQNEQYKSMGIANIQKISTPWNVIRKGKQIVSAFPQGKSTLDFRGTLKGGIPVSFDAKESENEKGLPLKYIQEHQVEYIRFALTLGEVSFIICEIKPEQKVYLVREEMLYLFGIDGSRTKAKWDVTSFRSLQCLKLPRAFAGMPVTISPLCSIINCHKFI